MSIAQTIAAMAEQSSQLYFSFDVQNNKFIYQNHALKSFLDAGQDFNFTNIRRLIHPEDIPYFFSKIREGMNGLTIDKMEFRVLINGVEHWLRLFVVLIKDENGNSSLTGFAEDISVSKTYFETLHQHNTKKNAILNILFHDLAGPIGIIDSISSLLRSETNILNNLKVEKYISIISQTSKACGKLIRDFINQEFLESTNVKLLKTRVDLLYRLKDSIHQYQASQNETGITFNFRTSLTNLLIELDEDKFLQVVHNLISNSLKFTKDGGSIDIILEESGSFAVITIKDSGIGIPQQFHSTLFDKFTNARRIGLHGEHSIGLGMSTIKTIVEWHGGTISFESAENIGTTFRISLPK